MQKNRPSLSKNIIYNLILTFSGYLFPILTFPYVTRVLGPDTYGAANFVLSMVDYAVMLSSLGISAIGIREIAKCGGDENKLSSVFSSLLSLHIVLAAIVGVVYFAAIFLVEQFRENYALYLVGFIKIVANVFLIEWLYSGLQNFRYITLRTIAVKALYVVAIFVFVKSESDILPYILTTVSLLFVNALINWWYSSNFVRFRFSLSGVRNYLAPSFSMGMTSILLSFYSTFIVLYLGFVCGSVSVGYYSTSIKLYAIFLSLLGAFNSGLMPYVNSLFGSGGKEAIKETISKSLNLVMMVAVPTAVFGILMANEIINVVAGAQYQNSILPFRIIILNVILVGLSQVTELQVLLTLNKTRQILFTTAVSVIFSVTIMLLFASKYGEIAAACAVTIPHVLETSLLYFFARRAINFRFPWKPVALYLLLSTGIVVMVFLTKRYIENIYIRLLSSSAIVVVLYVSSLFAVKDQMVLALWQKGKEVLRKFSRQ